MGKRTAHAGLGSLATGAVTALAIAVQSGLAAVVGIVIARELGRTAETDGFFAASIVSGTTGQICLVSISPIHK